MVKDLKVEYINKLDLLNKANQDPLTKLYNRRAFMHYYHKLTSEHSDSFPISVAFIDLDHFKRVNDQYGHIVGDRVLQNISNLITDHLRSIDIIARYGGEEFVVILPKCNKEDAMTALQRIRKTIEKGRIQVNEHMLKVTISVGIATTSEVGSKLLLKAADDAVYLAKEKGRNMVVCTDIDHSNLSCP